MSRRKNGRITKASEVEKRRYVSEVGYPLYGYVTVSGQQCPIEQTRDHGTPDDGWPKYEVMAPKGHYFLHDEARMLLCETLADITERTKHAALTEGTPSY